MSCHRKVQLFRGPVNSSVGVISRPALASKLLTLLHGIYAFAKKKAGKAIALLLVFWLMLGSVSTYAENAASIQLRSLAGDTKTLEALTKRRCIVIVTPSRKAAEETRLWAKALADIDRNVYPIIDIISLDIPFYIEESYARERAREKIPEQYWSQTWVNIGDPINERFGISEGVTKARVFVMSKEGEIRLRYDGLPSKDKLGAIQAQIDMQKSASK